MMTSWTHERPRYRRLHTASAVALILALLASLLVTNQLTAEAATDTDPSFEVIASDLEFILRQIKIAEAHAAGGDLLCADPSDDQGGTCIPSPFLPWGLRTVDGSYNNLLDGQQQFGAADQPFPRLLPLELRAGEPIPPGAPGGPAGTPTSYTSTTGFVYDSEPRVISNLIVDLTDENPAAVAVAAEVEGSVIDADGRIFIPNVSPDEGLSAPFNTWMTFFGQFFDHGLDLVNKGGSGTVVIPLREDDPLWIDPAGPDGILEDDPETDVDESADNVPNPPNFLMLTRATNDPGPDGQLGTADDVRDHNNQTTPFVDQNQTYTSHPSHQVFLREYAAGPVDTGRLLDAPVGGLATWADVKAQASERLGIVLTDMDVTNVPLLLTDPYGNFIPGPGGLPQFALEGGLYEEADGGPVPATAMRTGHAFLDDIAHAAAPTPDNSHDTELLAAHFITGDGRGNENIGLTAVHHIFHAEHNRMTGHIEDVLAANPQLDAAYRAAGVWDYGQRLFQAARFVTEMQYQHLVFEEFARTIQPLIDAAPLNESTYHLDLDAAIFAEFAHTVYRFGHSMLTETVERSGFDAQPLSLLEAFLNPRAFRCPVLPNDVNGTCPTALMSPEEAAGAIVNGMVNEPGSGIDEFVTETLRNELLGLPLDLATINMARGRDAGVASLQTARQTFYNLTLDPELRPYTSWNDFGLHLKNSESLVNFVAAYGNHPTITGVSTVAGKRAAAQALLDVNDPWLAAPAATTGVATIDFWMGGLAEAPTPFGGMLGSTFNYVFEKQLENLQNGDRFYYLSRNIGLNLFHQLEANSFAGLIRRTTDATLVPAEIFQTPDLVFDLNDDPADLTLQGLFIDGDGAWRFDGGEHIHMHGTAGPDRMRGGIGDDHFWGYGGDDHITGGAGANAIVGGAGNDILYGMAGDDNIKGGQGNDAIHGGPGEDLLLGGSGRDFIVHGIDVTQSFAGTDDDFVLGGPAHDIIAGNEGDDWLEGGGGSDLVQGDNSNGFQDDPNGGHDVLYGGSGNDDLDAEGGDDIMLTSPGVDRHEGMLGFDWVTHKGDPLAANADMDNTVFQPPSVQNFRDRYDLVEAISGWQHNDVLRGVGTNDAQGLGAGHELTQEHLDRIIGFRDLLGGGANPPHAAAFMLDGGRDIRFNNIMLGGAGSDILEGRGGDDFIDGSAWLDVYLMANGIRYEGLSHVPPGQTQSLQGLVFAGALDPGDIEIMREIVVEDEDFATVVNTAVFSDLMDNYEITTNSDGTVQVAHVAGTQTDGTDTLRNITRLTFADGSVDLVPGGNSPAFGTVTIEGDDPPIEDEALIAVVDADDVDGGIDATTFTFSWERETEPDVWGGTDGSDAEFFPTDNEVGMRLRVVVTFEDGTGNLETLTSEPTAPVVNVNDLPVGPSLSNSTPNVGDTVTAIDLTDDDGLTTATLDYQWQQGDGTTWTDITGANAVSFTVTEDQAGDRIRVVVTYTDDHGTPETATSGASAIVAELAPIASVAPTSLTFPATNLGETSAAQEATVSNSGTGPLTVSDVSITGADAGQFAFADGCTSAVAPGGSCTVGVTFAPTVAGPRTAELVIAHDGPQPSLSVSLSGEGVGATPVATLLGSTSFGTRRVGTTREQLVRVRNDGPGDLLITSVTSTESAFTLVHNCPSNLAVRARCDITITFRPTSPIAYSGTLSVVSNASNSPTTATLTGSGR